MKPKIYCKPKLEEWKGKMKPLSIIYWTRVLLGVLAGLISTLLSSLAPMDFNVLNGVSVALLVYIVTYYVYKAKFPADVVEKRSKIFSQGVGAYFIAWIVSWGLLYTVFVYPILAS